MSKKVIVISASFRKGGNSDRLADEFIRGATEGGNEVEKIYLSDKKIENCRGCWACQKIGHCVIQDDMAEFLTKLKGADVAAFATPIYFYGMCGAMKNFLDRTFPLFPDKQHFQEVYLMAAAQEDLGTTVQSTRTGLENWIRCFENLKLSGVIFAGGVTDKGDIDNHPALLESYEAGKKL